MSNISFTSKYLCDLKPIEPGANCKQVLTISVKEFPCELSGKKLGLINKSIFFFFLNYLGIYYYVY